MRIETLKFFVEVAECGSFTQAAHNLFISQQGISRAIRSLEKDLGVELFSRNKHDITPTEAGEAVLSFAKSIVDSERDMRDALTRFIEKSEVAEQPTVVVSSFTSNVVLVHLREAMERAGVGNARFKELDLRDTIRLMEQDDLMEPAIVLLFNNELPCLLHSDAISFTPWLSVDTVLVCPDDFPLRRKRKISIKDLQTLPIAHYKDPLIDRALAKMGTVAPLENIAMSSSNVDMVASAVQQGRVCLITDSLSVFLQGGYPNTRILPIHEAPTLSFGVLEPAGQPLSYDRADFIQRFQNIVNDACKAYIKKHPLDYPVVKPRLC